MPPRSFDHSKPTNEQAIISARGPYDRDQLIDLLIGPGPGIESPGPAPLNADQFGDGSGVPVSSRLFIPETMYGKPLTKSSYVLLSTPTS